MRGWIIYSWIALPTVMYGAYALLRLLTLTQPNALRPFRLTWFRVGHAHAGVLLLKICSDTQYPMASRDVRRHRLISICRLTMNHSESAVFLRSLGDPACQLWARF